MFDIGFFEIVLVAVVALLVLGPERLPHAVRMTGAFMGKVRRMMLNVREEFEREMNAMDMQQRLKEEMEKTGLNEARKSVEEVRQQLHEQVNGMHQDVQNSIAPPASTATKPEPDSEHEAVEEPVSAESSAPQPPATTEPEPPKHS